MCRVVPQGRSGNTAIEHFRVTEFEVRMAAWRGERGTRLDKTYTRLLINNQTVMSDTDMEHISNGEALRRARGRVFVGGLGLGMVTHGMAAKPEVTTITVMEVNADVIALVAPTLPAKVAVVQGNVLTYVPPREPCYETIYFDIWSGICTDNLEQINMLHRRWRARLVPGGWMDSWQADVLRYRRQQERRAGW